MASYDITRPIRQTDSNTRIDNMKTTILALDLGTQTGWALRSQDNSIHSGSQSFKSQRFEGGGMRFLRFKRWLTEIKGASVQIDAVYFEETLDHTYIADVWNVAKFTGGFPQKRCDHHLGNQVLSSGYFNTARERAATVDDESVASEANTCPGCACVVR